MNLGLLLPAGLLALFALALPVLLHLVRQSEQKRVEFAALRWLSVRARPRRRPRLDEWLLLLLRLLLLALLALWLAQPVWFGAADARPWLLVHPAIDPSRAPPASSADEQRRWLAPGFPSLEQPSPASNTSIGSLMRELDAALAADATVRVLIPAQFDATDAQRPVLRRKVQWRAVPDVTAFTRGDPARPIQLVAHVDAGHRGALPYLRAATAAWTSASPLARAPEALRQLGPGEDPRPGDTHLLWLANAPVPAVVGNWVERGGTVLLAHDGDIDHIDWRMASVAWRGDDGAPLAQRVRDGKGAWIRLLVPLDPQSLPALLESGFAAALQDLLATSPPVATRAHADTYAPVAGAAALGATRLPQPLGPWLAGLIALLFVIERLLAASPRRARA